MSSLAKRPSPIFWVSYLLGVALYLGALFLPFMPMDVPWALLVVWMRPEFLILWIPVLAPLVSLLVGIDRPKVAFWIALLGLQLPALSVCLFGVVMKVSSFTLFTTNPFPDSMSLNGSVLAMAGVGFIALGHFLRWGGRYSPVGSDRLSEPAERLERTGGVR